MNIASFFSGCGGMDLGFHKAGFDIEWANENASLVWQTFERNFPNTLLSKVSIKKIIAGDIPNVCGFIGGPPCQSWSNAGSRRGMLDYRGMLFFDYINLIAEKQPLFFVAENVEGLLSERNRNAYNMILSSLEDAGYDVRPHVLNARDYDVPQSRKRIFFVGYRSDLDLTFDCPPPAPNRITVRQSIGDLIDNAIPALDMNYSRKNECIFPNHEYWEGSYSYIFMSRNRVLDWDSQSFTVQASGRQTSFHPQAPAMIPVEKDVRILDPNHIDKYRRLSVRECARLQTFPDDFEFIYDNLNVAYKMIGNSVPVNLALAVAEKIKQDLTELNITEWFPRLGVQQAIG